MRTQVAIAMQTEEEAREAEKEMFSAMLQAELAAGRAKEAERLYQILREKAIFDRKCADASVMNLPGRHTMTHPFTGCPPPWYNNFNHTVDVVENYVSQQEGVLGLRVGERLHICWHDATAKWLYGVMQGGQAPVQGWFPARAVKPAPGN